jgi:hypothetical protein
MHSITDPLVHKGLAEWQPLLSRVGFEWRAYPPGVIIYLLPLALFAALALSLFLAPTMDDAALVAIAALFIIGAFVSARNMALAVIALSIPLARHFGIFLGNPSASLLTRFVPMRRVVSAEPAQGAANSDWRFNPALAIGLAIAVAAANGLLSNRLTIDEHSPVGAVAFMKQHNLHGNVLGDYDWGNYLTWHTAPPSKVFVDGRSDQLFPSQVIADYYDFSFGSPNAESVLDRYPHDFVLLPPGSSAYSVVANSPNWKLIYRDSDAALFARAASQAAQLPGVPAIGSAGPKFFP